MTINNPFIKDQKNIEWLQNNFETFLDYMAKHHSLVDCWHTVLDLSSFNDAYIEKLIKDVERSDKRELQEKQKRQKNVKLTTKKDQIEEKNTIVEQAVQTKIEQKQMAEDLLD